MSPSQRYALVGKTGAGKTTLAVALASLLLPWGHDSAWETWWGDSKGQREDLDRLRRWGYTEGAKGHVERRLIRFRSDADGSQSEHAQQVALAAAAQENVLLVIDEYTSVVESERRAGRGLLHAFTRGRGLDLGVIGMTQEPVFVPRQLLSQAAHIFLLNLSFARDVDWARKVLPDYIPPLERGDAHGFYHVATDLDGRADYYPHAAAFAAAATKKRTAA